MCPTNNQAEGKVNQCSDINNVESGSSGPTLGFFTNMCDARRQVTWPSCTSANVRTRANPRRVVRCHWCWCKLRMSQCLCVHPGSSIHQCLCIHLQAGHERPPRGAKGTLVAQHVEMTPVKKKKKWNEGTPVTQRQRYVCSLLESLSRDRWAYFQVIFSKGTQKKKSPVVAKYIEPLRKPPPKQKCLFFLPGHCLQQLCALASLPVLIWDF